MYMLCIKLGGQFSFSGQHWIRSKTIACKSVLMHVLLCVDMLVILFFHRLQKRYGYQFPIAGKNISQQWDISVNYIKGNVN